MVCLSQVSAHDAHTEQGAASLAISLATDSDGRLWQARASKGQVWVSYSADGGQHFSSEVAANPTPMKVAADAEARPKIAVASNGNIYLSWTESLKKPFAGYIWFARSVDGGKTFEPPYIVHHDRAEITHRFDALQVSAEGEITVAWVDKRDLLAAKAAGKPYDGAAIYYAVSSDQGKSFASEKKLADSSCECCRIAMTSKADGTVAVLWRHVFAGSERDHAMAEIPRPGAGKAAKPAIVRASYGRWKIDGCPHHGAALALGEGFGYHLAYFDGAGDKPGLRLVRMDGQAWVTTPPRRIGDAKKNAGHPALLSVGDKVWLAWQERSSEGMDIVTMASLDGGKTWGLPTVAVHSAGKLDYPQWLNLRGQALLAVNSAEKGLLLVPGTVP
ncbi:sialidase family protein [Methylophilus luteus]|uniref:Sialidase family protein n=1 Tax=Methylophilus luteus TaxID=640108 RepID=A0ABW3FAD3_9PROT